MKHKNPAITETLRILVGMLICLALMLGVYALIQKFSLAVLFGGLVGTVIAVGNFFFMAIGLSNLADDAEEGKIKTEDIDRLKKFRANPSDESWITG